MYVVNAPSRLTHLNALMATLEGHGFSHPGQIRNGLPKIGTDEHGRIMNAFAPGNPGNLAGMGFTVDIYEQIVAKTFDIKYGELLWTKFIPQSAIEQVNPGTKTVSAKIRDWRGRGAFRAAVGKDIPTVQIAAGKISVPIESGAVSAHIDIDEIRQVAFGFEGMNALTEYGVAMRRAYELHREVVAFYGYTPLGFDGYLNTSGVPLTTAGTKAGGGTTWAVATAAEIILDITTAISTIVTNSNGIWRPNRIALPTAQFLKISLMNAAGGTGTLVNESVMTYLLRTLPAIAGGPVEIVELRYLAGAGAGVTNRMIVESVTNETFWMPEALPFRVLPPQDNQFLTSLFGEYRFGSLLRPYPTSALFMDGI